MRAAGEADERRVCCLCGYLKVTSWPAGEGTHWLPGAGSWHLGTISVCRHFCHHRAGAATRTPLGGLRRSAGWLCAGGGRALSRVLSVRGGRHCGGRNSLQRNAFS